MYLAVGKLGLMLAFLHPSASPVWPATGVAMGILLLFGMRYWPGILLGAFLVNVTTAGSVATSAAIAAGNALEALSAAILIRNFAGGTRAFESTSGVLKFALFAGGASAVSASIGVAALAARGFVPWNAVPPVWFTWWFGDVIGALTVTPLLVLWARARREAWPAGRVAECAALAVFIGFIGMSVFGNLLFPKSAHYPLTFLCIPPILWAAIRFGPRETTTAVFVLSWIAILGAVQGWGPFTVFSVNTSLLLLQSFVGVASLTGMSLAGAMEERRSSEASLERKVAERTHALAMAHDRDRANAQRLQDMIDQMPIAAVAADEHLTVLHANRQFLALFSVTSPDDVERKTLPTILRDAALLSREPQESLLPLLRLFDEHARALKQELPLQNGKVLSCDYVPIASQGMHHGHLLLCRDITEEKRIDQAKSEFLSLSSHQLRTPLTGIRWSFGRLEKMLRGRVSALEEELIFGGKQAAARMCETIDTLLMIARIESRLFSPHFLTISLSEFLQDIVVSLSDAARRKKQTMSVICPHSLSVRTDPRLLREICTNFLGNAVKYTPEGGVIRVRACLDGDDVRIDVEDTGIGIPAHEQQRVFQKFFRAQNARLVDQDGTGLGLYLAYTAASLLEATLSFTSVIGRGTTFTILHPGVMIEHRRDMRTSMAKESRSSRAFAA